MGSKKGSGLKGLRNSLTSYFFSKKGKRIPDPKNMKDFWRAGQPRPPCWPVRHQPYYISKPSQSQKFMRMFLVKTPQLFHRVTTKCTDNAIYVVKFHTLVAFPSCFPIMSWSKSNYEDENPFADPNESNNMNRLYEAKVPHSTNQFSTGEKPLWLQQELLTSPTPTSEFSSSSSKNSAKMVDASANSSSRSLSSPGPSEEIDP